LFLDERADLFGEGSRPGNALLAAVMRGNSDVVEELMEAGADAEAEIYICLVLAAMHHRLEDMALLLLTKGCSRIAH
jgi:hypothetical protein